MHFSDNSTPSSAKNASNLALARSVSNVRKWAAIGVNVSAVLGAQHSAVRICETAAANAASDHAEEAAHNNNNNNNRAGFQQQQPRGPSTQNSIQRQLVALTSRIQEARQEQLCQNAPQSGNRFGNNKQHGAAAGAKRGREGEEEEDAGGRARRPSGKGAAPPPLREPELVATPQQSASPAPHQLSDQRATTPNAPATRQKKPSGKASAAAAAGANSPPGKRQTRLTMYTNFSQAVPTTPFKELVDLEPLLHAIRADLDDPNRIQQPLLTFGVLTTSGESNFSLATSKERALFDSSVHPHEAASAIAKVILLWKDELFVADGAIGLDFVARVAATLSGVELVTFNASALLLPMLSFTNSTFTSSNVSDVRVMAWMVTPSDGCCDFDSLYCHYNSGARAASSPMRSLAGVCDRVPQLVVLYRKAFGTLGCKGLLQAFIKQEKHIALLCSLMKYDGFPVNISAVDSFKQHAQSVLNDLKSQAAKLVPSNPTFNIQSPDDCRDAIFTQLKLGQHLDAAAVGSSSKTGKLSTAEEVLKQLTRFHPLPGIIINYRKIAKVYQTYVEGVLDGAVASAASYQAKKKTLSPPCSDPRKTMSTGEDPEEVGFDEEEEIMLSMQPNDNIRTVHANFLQEGTDTGRLSCVDPNLQNLPRVNSEDMFSSFVRGNFVAPPGCTLVAVDYEQIELRVLAHLCEDASLLRALSGSDSETSDIHRRIASVVFKRPSKEITKEQRTQAKRVVFGVLYGIGATALAAQLGETVERCRDIQTLFKGAFPQIDRYIRRVVEYCRAEKCVRTMFGRWRPLPDIDESDASKRSAAERQAFNTVIQGSAADIVKRAMIEVYRNVLLTYPEVRLRCQVHDELVFTVPETKLSTFVPKLVTSMVRCVSLLVPLKVSVKVGPSLGTLEDWTVEHDLGIYDVAGDRRSGEVDAFSATAGAHHDGSAH